jgi:hypothetical protein
MWKGLPGECVMDVFVAVFGREGGWGVRSGGGVVVVSWR